MMMSSPQSFNWQMKPGYAFCDNFNIQIKSNQMLFV